MPPYTVSVIFDISGIAILSAITAFSLEHIHRDGVHIILKLMMNSDSCVNGESYSTSKIFLFLQHI